jgi:hypothetical protein
VAGAPTGGARIACAGGCRSEADPVTITTRFGKKLKVPSTFQIKHQLLLFWLKNQSAKEAAEGQGDEAVVGGELLGSPSTRSTRSEEAVPMIKRT